MILTRTIMRWKIESISLAVALILSILRFWSHTISPGTFTLAIRTQVCVVIARYLWLRARRSMAVDALVHKVVAILREIDRAVSAWIRSWGQLQLETNEFFEWLLPGVNVNIACAEHEPHPGQPLRHRNQEISTCLLHNDHFRGYQGNSTTCLFKLKNLPQKIEERLDRRFRERKDELVLLELSKNNRLFRRQPTALIGWNIFGIAFKCPREEKNSEALKDEDAVLFMKLRTQTEAMIARKTDHSHALVKRAKSMLFRWTGIELCIRLNMNRTHADWTMKRGHFFVSFPHQFKCGRQAHLNYTINEPICKRLYVEEAAAASGQPPVHTLLHPVLPEDFDNRLVLSRSHTLKTLEHIKHLKRLKALDIDDTNVRDLSPIRHFLGLGELSFSSTKVRSLDPLKKLENLRELQFDSTQVADLEPIRNLNNLEVLRFANTNVDKFLPIISLKRLHTLAFSAYPETDLDELRLVLDTLINDNTNISIDIDGKRYTVGSSLDDVESRIIEIKHSRPIKNLPTLDKISR